jgi:hypothetical protein
MSSARSQPRSHSPHAADLFVESEMLFDRGDADFELEAFVDFALLELSQLGVETIYLRRKVGLDAVDLLSRRGCHLWSPYARRRGRAFRRVP